MDGEMGWEYVEWSFYLFLNIFATFDIIIVFCVCIARNFKTFQEIHLILRRILKQKILKDLVHTIFERLESRILTNIEYMAGDHLNHNL